MLLDLPPDQAEWSYTHRGASLRRPAANQRAEIDRARKTQLMAIAGNGKHLPANTDGEGGGHACMHGGGAGHSASGGQVSGEAGNPDEPQTCSVQ